MNDTEFDALLRGSAPRSFAADDRVLAEARTLAMRSAESAVLGVRPRRPRPLPLVVGAILVTLGLAAGGVAVAAVLSPDVSIPISYTTVSGSEVSCTVVVGSTDREVVGAIRSVVATADLESLSQTAYRRAYDELVVAGSPGDPRLGRLRAFHIESAVVRELWMALPGDLQPMDRAILFHSDCSGDLE